MSKDKKGENNYRPEDHRPEFPKRAVITGGMPYGNKELHFGHIGGVFVFADVYARFLRDRIGKENVIFVSGTDCYGSPIAESYRKLKEDGYTGTIKDFVQKNHDAQEKTLRDYDISLDLFGASGLGDTKEMHDLVSDRFIRRLYELGWLDKISTAQFYDEKAGTFLNGRQVVGKCPVQGCASEKGYADECDLGHQYMPADLIDPKSTLTGETPVMKNVDNYYFRLTDFYGLLKKTAVNMEKQKNIRPVVTKTIKEFLEPPVIYVMNNYRDVYESVKDRMAEHKLIEEPKKTSFTIEFDTLHERDEAVKILNENKVRFREGKTLVPFRITGNIEWGVKAPDLEGNGSELTVWVWPESLWAPISFTCAYLKSIGRPVSDYKKFWCSKDAKVYQFIGQDNIYFYGVAQNAMWSAFQSGNIEDISGDAPDGELQTAVLVANNHILFLDKKASSSGKVKPPMAADLLNYYTAEQLRMHWLSLALGQRSVSFQPKPFDPEAKPEDSDPVTKEGFLLSNVFNRIIRTCFYDTQKYFDGNMPIGSVSGEMINDSKKAVLDYERFMYKTEFHQVTYVLDSYIRKASKYMVKAKAEADKSQDTEEIRTYLVNTFHMIRTAAVLVHPFAPRGTEMLYEYLQLPEAVDFWSWDNIFKGFSELLPDEDAHKLKFLEPKVDFFKRHPSQFAEK